MNMGLGAHQNMLMVFELQNRMVSDSKKNWSSPFSEFNMVAMFQVRSVSFTVAGIGYPAAGEVLWLRHTPGGKPKEETTWEDDFPQKIAVSVLMTKTSSQLTLQNTIEIPPCKVLLLIVCCKFPSGWWFGTCFIFHSIWDNPSHWLSDFFKFIAPPSSVDETSRHRGFSLSWQLPRLNFSQAWRSCGDSALANTTVFSGDLPFMSPQHSKVIICGGFLK